MVSTHNVWVGVRASARIAIYALSVIEVSKLETPGYHSDGGGLYLQISPAVACPQ